MKVTKKRVDDGSYHIQAVATIPEVEQALDTALYNFAQQMRVRPEQGKHISQLIEEQLGISAADEVVATAALKELIPYAIDKSGIIPAYPPSAQLRSRLARGSQVEFEFTVAPKPDYELTSYEPVSIKVPPLLIDEHAVDEELAQLSDRYAEYVTDDPHPVGDGDHVLLAMEAKENGEVVPGLTTDGQTYTVGIGLMPPAFDEQLIGMDVGETRTISFSGPTFDDSGEQTTTEIEATVTVKEIQKKHVSVIDDAWVQKYMPFYKDAASMRKMISDGIERQQTAEYEQHKLDLAVSALVPRFQGSIADEVYEFTSRTMIQGLRDQLAQQGIPYEQFVEQQGGEQQLNMMMMLQTRESLVQGYALDAVFRHEGLEVTDEDLDEAARAMSPQDSAAFRDYMEKHGRRFALRETAERMVANRWLLEHAEIEYLD